MTEYLLQHHDELRSREYFLGLQTRLSWLRHPLTVLVVVGERLVQLPERAQATRLLPGPHGVFHYRDAAGVTALGPQPIEDPLRRVSLRRRLASIRCQNLVNPQQERTSLRLRTLLHAAVARQFDMLQNLPERLSMQAVRLKRGPAS